MRQWVDSLLRHVLPVDRLTVFRKGNNKEAPGSRWAHDFWRVPVVRAMTQDQSWLLQNWQGRGNWQTRAVPDCMTPITFTVLQAPQWKVLSHSLSQLGQDFLPLYLLGHSSQVASNQSDCSYMGSTNTHCHLTGSNGNLLPFDLRLFG